MAWFNAPRTFGDMSASAGKATASSISRHSACAVSSIRRQVVAPDKGVDLSADLLVAFGDPLGLAGPNGLSPAGLRVWGSLRSVDPVPFRAGLTP
jgi:hypothetical protein